MTSWRVVPEAPDQLFGQQVRLTAAAPESAVLSLGPMADATLQVEGEFGTGWLEVLSSNSGQGWVVTATQRHADLVPVRASCWLRVAVQDADEATDLSVTVAGRR